jgi:hypothetical protein
MDEEIKEYVDELLLTRSIESVIKDMKSALKKSRDLKEDLIKRNKDLLNVPSHIEMFEEIISYLRDKKISSLFERRILKFKDFK